MMFIYRFGIARSAAKNFFVMHTMSNLSKLFHTGPMKQHRVLLPKSSMLNMAPDAFHDKLVQVRQIDRHTYIYIQTGKQSYKQTDR
jgi:hypothetical protein